MFAVLGILCIRPPKAAVTHVTSGQVQSRKTRTMIKQLAAAASAVVLLGLSACGAASAAPEPVETGTAPSASAPAYSPRYDRDDGGGPDEVTPDRSTCVYDPTFNDNWHDDMLCGGIRPNLLPDDAYITRDEIEAAARTWELGHDDAYEQYLRDYSDFQERERQFDEEYLSQFDEDGNCLKPNGCAMQRP